jgi:hypothetical protein
MKNMSIESNIRRKASRRGYSVGKYRSGYVDKFAATHWQKPTADIWDASLDELEKFINSKPPTVKRGAQ